ncbi:hypothetical protein HPP92_027635 [Vanilla planifolia]|uniref:Clathrin adaptor alpha/beta/gamma-adaptin appendage Ig-like subdomain domain-containing protein n=1 Tax=Vanilla planifolia TaxID=51239 RepID=A0A835P983_VANPL|nr:hypothetical protein HPP92_027635 [Vanilla planifolia]
MAMTMTTALSILLMVLQRILMGTDVVKNVNKNNASHAVLFEHWPREPNIRYLGLENMSRMLMVSDVQDIIKRHQAQIITSLKDPDISIRRRSLDLLYGMCDISNAKDIVEELLQSLSWTFSFDSIYTAEFAMREELALKIAILAEKFAPDLSWYVDVILQLIDKAGDFVSDDIWYRVVQFVTNNEDLQPYAAAKARVYLEKPALHETMVKVTKANDFANMYGYESYIDVEIQQRAVEYFLLSQKGAALMDVLAEMPKFPERQSALLRKAEDVEADTAEQSAIRLRSLQQTSNALVLTDQIPPNGSLPVGQLNLVKITSQNMENSVEQGGIEAYGAVGKVDLEQAPSPDLLGDLLGPLAIEGPPSAPIAAEKVHGLETNPGSPGPLALASLGDQLNTVQPTVNIEERFNALCLKDSGVLYEDPHIQIGVKAEWRAHHGRLVLFLGNKNVSPLSSVKALILPPRHLKMELSLVPETIPPRAQVQCPLDVVSLQASRDVPVLDFSYKFGDAVVNVKLRLPTVLNKFLQPTTVSAEEFFSLLEINSRTTYETAGSCMVRGVKALSLPEMANLFASLHLGISQGLDLNPNNLVASATFYSENSRSILCLIRVETDPADRTQLRLTVASGDPILTFELKELIKEYLISIPAPSLAAAAPTAVPLQPQSPMIPASNDPEKLFDVVHQCYDWLPASQIFGKLLEK